MNARFALTAVGSVAILVALAMMANQTWVRAHLGGVDSQLQLAYAYATGNGVDRDDVEATRWYRRAAEAGDARGAFALASRYDEGRGVEKDLGQAVDWFTRAAENGSEEAALVLATRFHMGIGVPKDDVRAAMWLIVGQNYAWRRSDGQKLLESLKESLSDADLAEARRIAAQWKSVHAPEAARTAQAASPKTAAN